MWFHVLVTLALAALVIVLLDWVVSLERRLTKLESQRLEDRMAQATLDRNTYLAGKGRRP